MRALLIVNPHATGAGRTCRAAVVTTLRTDMTVDCAQTRYRGHARELAADAAAGGTDLVVTLGGDGTANEAVNGLLSGREAAAPALPRLPPPGGREVPPTGRELPPPQPTGREVPPAGGGSTAFAPLPCGSTNVFARALGLPRDPLFAARRIGAAASAGRRRSIGLGLADDRYFTFCAGLGLDARAVRAVEAARDAGSGRAAPATYVAAALRAYLTADRRRPALLVGGHGGRPDIPVFLAIVSNTAPWTYVGSVAVNPNPGARFDGGLDLFGPRRLAPARVITLLPRLFGRTVVRPTAPDVLALHDEPELLLRARRPTSFQIDGEYLGERSAVRLRSVPDALPVIV